MGKYLLMFLWMTSLTASALEVPKPAVSIRLADSGIEVSSLIALPVKPCEAYAMLTDYDDLPKFIPGLLESHYQRIAKNRVRVMQVGEVQVFIFHVQMESLLEMEETPNQRILFRQIKGDFVSYGGEWDFSGNADGTLVSYDAALSFKPYVPVLLARSILENDVKEKFAAIAQEAIARKKQGSLHCSAENR
jgi:ribosome-associated toxin RatA of RatAB toxin-antitoxin module